MESEDYVRSKVIGRTIAIGVIPVLIPAILIGLVVGGAVVFTGAQIPTLPVGSGAVTVSSLFLTLVAFAAGFIVGSVWWLRGLRGSFDEVTGEKRETFDSRTLYETGDDYAERHSILPNLGKSGRLHMVHPSVWGLTEEELRMLNEMDVWLEQNTNSVAVARGVVIGFSVSLMYAGAVFDPVLFLFLFGFVLLAPIIVQYFFSRVVRELDRMMYDMYGEEYVRFVVRELMPKDVNEDMSSMYRFLSRLYVGPSLYERFDMLDEHEVDRIVEEETTR